MILDTSGIEFRGQLAKEMSELIIERFFKKPMLNQFHHVVGGIKAKTQVPYVGRLGLVGKKKKGNCQIEKNPSTVTTSEKFWNPEYITDRFEECWDHLENSFLVWSLKNGYKKPDLDGTVFAMFLQELLGDAMYEMALRIAWFSDKNHTNVGAGTGTEMITAGTDHEYFNMTNGFMNQIYEIVANSAARRVTIAENAEASYSAQLSLESDRALKTFESLKLNADMRLRGMPKNELVYITSQSLVDNYDTYLRSRNVDSSFRRIENGTTSFNFDGIEVVEFDFYDRYIREYFDNGTKYHLPHFCLLTYKTNLKIGTEEEKNLAEFEAWYNRDEKKYKADFGFNVDSLIHEDNMIQVAY